MEGTSDPQGSGSGGTLAVILAAGAGSRFGGRGHKLTAPLNGRPLVTVAIESAVEAGVGPVLVVGGALDLSELVPAGVELVDNPLWAHGQASSLQVAVSEARRRRARALVVGLGDQPGIPPTAWRAVAASVAPLAVATYQGRRRNPVRLGSEVWADLPTQGDEGARVLMSGGRWSPEEIPCPGNPDDIDTEEDLRRWS